MKSVVLFEMKTELKTLTAQIRQARPLYRLAESNRARKLPFEYPEISLGAACERFRYLHIVRCLLRGRTMDQIEQKRRYTPYGFQRRIDALLATYQVRLDAERAQAAQDAAQASSEATG